MNEGDRGLSLEQAADQLHVQARTLRIWIRDKKLTATKVGRRWLVLQSTVDKILRGEATLNGRQRK